jgi:hypothetical protein
MGSMFPPAASSSLSLPICYRSPPAIPSLGDCFPCGSIDLGKYVLYSSALRQRARWHTSLALSFGGHGTTLPFADNSVNADERREPKTRTQRFVYARRDTEDGPLEIIPPEESMLHQCRTLLLLHRRCPPPDLNCAFVLIIIIISSLRRHAHHCVCAAALIIVFAPPRSSSFLRRFAHHLHCCARRAIILIRPSRESARIFFVASSARSFYPSP